MAKGPKTKSEIVLYQTEDGRTRLECRFEQQNVWLTQALMAELFLTTVPNINMHLRNIYAEHELEPGATIQQYLIVRQEGARKVRRMVEHYNLEAILAVGYRVRSPRGTQFRQWATTRLKEYLVKGFVLDDERLKNPPGPGMPDYFDELLERIRDIRASERRMYLRLREIPALAADYRPDDAETQVFFQTVQNKLHFAVTGKTAPELIAERADAAKANMGLTTWHGSVVRKGDVTVAKNYLREGEITELNRVVTMFLDSWTTGTATRWTRPCGRICGRCARGSSNSSSRTWRRLTSTCLDSTCWRRSLARSPSFVCSTRGAARRPRKAAGNGKRCQQLPTATRVKPPSSSATCGTSIGAREPPSVLPRWRRA